MGKMELEGSLLRRQQETSGLSGKAADLGHPRT